MEISSTSLLPHSCDFCKRLVLYKRDGDWWKKALGSQNWWKKALGIQPDVEEHIAGTLSVRARTWLLGKFEQAFVEGSLRHHENDRLTCQMKGQRWKARHIMRWNVADSSECFSALDGAGILDCTFGEIKQAADEGCIFSREIWRIKMRYQAYDHCTVEDTDFLAFWVLERGEETEHTVDIVKFGFCRIHFVIGTGGLSSWSRAIGPVRRRWTLWTSGDSGMRWEDSYYLWKQGFRQEYSIVALHDSLAGREIVTRPVNAAPNSEASLRQVRGWLAECTSLHPECRELTAQFMPRRLLEVSKLPSFENTQVRLRDTTDVPLEPYAVLSYCWGGPQQLKTTIDSVQRHMVTIDEMSLPASLRDAILVTERVGLRFLWVDALCIIQDDPDDMMRELAQMAQIYNEAFVTILASKASGVEQGFLGQRLETGRDTPDQFFGMAFRCLDNNMSSVLFFPAIDDKMGEPLNSRAWPLQEKLLSKRTIAYTTLQTRWACRTRQRCDGYRDISLLSKGVDSNGVEWYLGPDWIAAIGHQDRQFLLNKWYRTLNHYTKLTLTYETDRFQGISGIAAHFGKKLCDDYVVGLWKSDMHKGLLWEVMRTDKTKMDMQPRSREYRGPSWSWLAVSGAKETHSHLNEVDEKIERHIDFELLDYEIVYAGETADLSPHDRSFGPFVSASLTLKGRLGRARCYWKKRRRGQQYKLKVLTREGNEKTLGIICSYDALEEKFVGVESASMDVYLLLTLSSHGYRSGLILKQVMNSSYTRLGTFRMDYMTHWDDGTMDVDENAINQTEKELGWENKSPSTITLR